MEAVAERDIITEESILCNSKSEEILFISKSSQDPHFCDGIPHCASGADEVCPYVTVRHNSKSVNITREDWKTLKGGADIFSEQYIICENTQGKNLIISKWFEDHYFWKSGTFQVISKFSPDPHFCDGVNHCASGADELCPYVTVRHNSKSVNVTREDWKAGGGLGIEEDSGIETVACKRNGHWEILKDCVRCNTIPHCDNEVDELDCPAYTSPSFELPIVCCLVVLVLGVLLHLGWRAVTRAAEKEAKEVVGRQLEEAVDSIVQAAVEGLQFSEASYETLHSQPGESTCS